MHIPDGLLDARTCWGSACLAGAGVAWAGRQVTARWNDRTVPSGEWHRLQLARRVRTFSPNRPLRFQVRANALGLLFIRPYERAEKVHRALLARGSRLEGGRLGLSP